MNAKQSYELCVKGIISEIGVLPSILLQRHDSMDYIIHFHLR